MIIVSRSARPKTRARLLADLRRADVPVRLLLRHGGVQLESASWREYWEPCKAFLSVDARLVQRLNRLKAAWLEMIRRPRNRRCQLTYCWRYFGLLHHTLAVASDEPWRGDPLPVLHRILAFGTFTAERGGKDDVAACVFSASHPVYLLGRLGLSAPPPTPKHVPLVLPAGRKTPHYCYRQFSLGAHADNRLLVFPATDLHKRSLSFSTIDRLARLLSDRPDPYHRPRSILLARRVLKPLFRHWVQTDKRDKLKNGLSVLDVGAGTGHLSAKSVRHLLETIPSARSTTLGFHFVDTSGPTPGRSFGLS